jgi:hypothetical protein
MKLKLACAFFLLAFAVSFLLLAIRREHFPVYVFLSVTLVMTAILTVINSFVLLYLLKLKTMNRYEIPHSGSVHDADNGTDCPPGSGCQSKPST